jgi:hypothetical protein
MNPSRSAALLRLCRMSSFMVLVYGQESLHAPRLGEDVSWVALPRLYLWVPRTLFGAPILVRPFYAASSGSLVRELDVIANRVIWFTWLLAQDRTAGSTTLKIRRSELYFTDRTLIDNSRLCWKSESRKMTRQPAVRTELLVTKRRPTLFD